MPECMILGRRGEDTSESKQSFLRRCEREMFAQHRRLGRRIKRIPKLPSREARLNAMNEVDAEHKSLMKSMKAISRAIGR